MARLLQLIPLYDSYRFFLSEMTAALTADGHTVLTLCGMGKRNMTFSIEQEAGCRHLDFPRGMNPLGFLKAAQSVRRAVDEFSPDVVHAHFSPAILTAALARRGSKNRGIRWLGTFQGLQFPLSTGLKRIILRHAESYAASRMDSAWVLTADDKNALRQAAPRAPVILQKTPGFGCADRFIDTPRPDSAERRQRRSEQGFDDKDLVLIFVGRLVAFKGFDLAARAFFAAQRMRPELRWIVVGGRDSIHPTGLTDAEWQHFCQHPAVTWTDFQPDALPWLDLADAMLFPTSREGMPVSVMEALARGVPVLTRKVRGCRELITEGVNGAFFESSTVDAITRALIDFTPYQPSAPIDQLRRSHWIDEMRKGYGF